MPNISISNSSLKSIAAGNRDQFYWDTELKGFGIKVSPKGTKTYFVQYRLGGRGTPTRRVSIGRHGSPWTPQEARKEARKILGDVAHGKDPAVDKSNLRRQMTVSELCDVYLEKCEAGTIVTKFGTRKKASTISTDKGRIERHIKPLLGNRKIGTLCKKDVRNFLEDVAQGKTATDEKTTKRGRSIVTGGKGTATRTLGLLGGILSYAVEQGLLETNPAHGLVRYKDEKRERFLSREEFARLGQVLALAEAEGENPSAIATIKLLLLTGCRKSEILSLKWSQIDFERALLRLSDTKTGGRVVPLGATSLEILSSLPRYEGTEYVFPASRGNGHYVGLPRVWEGIRIKAKLNDVRLHDLRHTFASVGADGGQSLYVVGKLLGHKSSETTQRYAHLSDNPLRTAISSIDSNIETMLAASIRNGS